MTWLLVIAAPLIGMLVGLMPSLGITMTVMMAWPLLTQVDPVTILCFYAAILVTSQFAGSVSALHLGLLGEHTSLPALRERNIIVQNHAQQSALDHTAMGSLIATVLSMALLSVLVWVGQGMTWLMRTEVLWCVAVGTVVMSLFWPGNSKSVNAMMIAVGLIIGMIGYRADTNQSFMTFGNAYLAGGIPIWPVLLGLYAVPCLVRISKSTADIAPNVFSGATAKLSVASVIRGSIVGFFIGMIPTIGHMISSSAAHLIEKFWHASDMVRDSLCRLTSAESANNAAYVSSLIPMLVLGIAIQPSEVLILDLITTKSWNANSMSNTATMIAIMAAMIYASITAWYLAGRASKPICDGFQNYRPYIVTVIIIIMAANILWMGWQSDQFVYYWLTFTISAALGLLMISRDTMPVILALLLQDAVFDTTQRIQQLWG